MKLFFCSSVFRSLRDKFKSVFHQELCSAQVFVQANCRPPPAHPHHFHFRRSRARFMVRDVTVEYASCDTHVFASGCFVGELGNPASLAERYDSHCAAMDCVNESRDLLGFRTCAIGILINSLDSRSAASHLLTIHKARARLQYPRQRTAVNR